MTKVLLDLQTSLAGVARAAVHQAGAVRSRPSRDELADIIQAFRTIQIRLGMRRDVLFENEVVRVVRVIRWPGFRFDCNE